MASETLTLTTPRDREVVMTRVFNAPRQMVFDALTQPELLQRWLEAPGRTLRVCDVDLRVGGAYRYVWRGAGKKDVGLRGTFLEIVPGARLVTIETWEDWDAGETRATTVLVERDGRTTLTQTVLFPSREVRDTVLKSGMEHGAAESFDRLAILVAGDQSNV